MIEGCEKYIELIKNKSADKVTETVLEHFRDRDRRHEFYKYFKKLQDIRVESSLLWL